MKQGLKTFTTAAAFAAGLATGPAIAETPLLFGTYATENDALMQSGFLPFLEALEAKSGGSLKPSVAAGGSVVKAKTSLFGLQDGLVDATFVPTVYHPAELPVSNLFVGLGSALSDVPAAIGALTEVIMFDCPECTEEFERWNMRFLGAWSITAYDMMCTKPVRTAEDVKGLRIRAAGHIVPLATALGATPINVPTTEIYEVLQRGAVDCTMGPPNFIDALSLDDVIKYVTDTNAGIIPTPTSLMLREDLWETLTPQQRQVLVDTAPIAVAGAAFGYAEAGEAAITRPDRTFELLQPDQTLVDAIAQATAGDYDRAVATAKERGVDNAEELAAKFMEAYDRWKDLVADIDSKEAYADLLRERLFSKYDFES